LKFRTDEDVLQRLLMSMGSVALGLGLVQLGFGIGNGWILAGLILTVGALHNATKPKEDYMQDELSVRINEKAGYHAFAMMLVLIVVINLLYFFKLWMPSLPEVCLLLFFVGIYVWLSLRWHFNKTGE
jgi:hypothetical protein